MKCHAMFSLLLLAVAAHLPGQARPDSAQQHAIDEVVAQQLRSRLSFPGKQILIDPAYLGVSPDSGRRSSGKLASLAAVLDARVAADSQVRQCVTIPGERLASCSMARPGTAVVKMGRARITGEGATAIMLVDVLHDRHDVPDGYLFHLQRDAAGQWSVTKVQVAIP